VTDDGSCLYADCLPGCTQAGACNYNPLATAEDFSCVYGCEAGCTLEGACNYNPDVDFDNGSCVMPGCMLSNALNYDPAATCEAPCYYDCVADLDGNGAMDMADFLQMLDQFGCVGDCEPFDVDDDGVVGVMDLQIFTSFFGALCD
jgi:hypothetical protein